ncbi:17832_t:CDS:1 [Funneliformis caledonium]|uniref:17832_t:CDS:1 n=1 Tax=Funneliformis caledonium TaxID=1117310 RepID=A0A9N9E6N5_9GLOM|nr:17832_t:CDS:1 [Funneliformis caledonium]
MTGSNNNQQQGFFVFKINENILSNNELNPNNPISLNNELNDYQIVYNSNYPFTIDRNMLINNSKKRTGSNKAPRPQNPFILYRRDMSARLKAESADNKIKEAKRSKEIAIRWKKETEEVKALFYALSRLAKQKHIEVYGKDYKYVPAKRGTKAKSRAKNYDNSGTDTDFIQTEPVSFFCDYPPFFSESTYVDLNIPFLNSQCQF